VSAPQSFVDVIIQAAEIIGKEKQKKPLFRPAGKREYLLRQSSRPAGGGHEPPVAAASRVARLGSAYRRPPSVLRCQT
jgi:hypothetical protein